MQQRVPSPAPARGWTDEPQPRHRDFSAAAALRQTLLWASRRPAIKELVSVAPVTRTLVQRFVAGETTEDAVTVTRTLVARGLAVSLDHLGEDTLDAHDAAAYADAVQSLIRRLAEDGLTVTAEVSVKLSALGQAIDERMALDHAHEICETARAAGTAVTVDMEAHTTVDSTLQIVRALRRQHPSTGCVIQASLRRSEDDCKDLAVPGSRVRLCKGAYQAPANVAWQQPREIRSAYLRCMRALVLGGAYPMAATHDPKLISATALLLDSLAPGAAHEYQMLYGIRPDEQARLLALGESVRVYVPYGTQWYSYLMRRMAERPANLALVLRALVSRS